MPVRNRHDFLISRAPTYRIELWTSSPLIVRFAAFGDVVLCHHHPVTGLKSVASLMGDPVEACGDGFPGTGRFFLARHAYSLPIWKVALPLERESTLRECWIGTDANPSLRASDNNFLPYGAV
jgi:hypothetical protein